jgi:putative copper resistance protein D
MSGADDVATILQALPDVLTRTAIGAAANVACLAWCAIVAAFALRRRVASWAKVAWCALAIVCIARAASGHANDAGWGSPAIWIHAVHIAAGGVWAGTVFLAAGLALSWRNWDVMRRQAFAQRISQAATLALIAVAISGFFNGWRMLGDAGISLHDPYTALLAAKLACVGLAVCLGAYNRWCVMPVLMEKDAAARFAAVLVVEGAALLVAMLLAAELGTTMPPM